MLQSTLIFEPKVPEEGFFGEGGRNRLPLPGFVCRLAPLPDNMSICKLETASALCVQMFAPICHGMHMNGAGSTQEIFFLFSEQ